MIYMQHYFIYTKSWTAILFIYKMVKQLLWINIILEVKESFTGYAMQTALYLQQWET
jgi:hypothetical protein